MLQESKLAGLHLWITGRESSHPPYCQHGWWENTNHSLILSLPWSHSIPSISSLVCSSQHTCQSLWNIHDHDVSSINFINCFVLINNSKLSIYIVMGMPMLCAYIHIYLHTHIHLHMYIYTHAPTGIHRHTYKAHMYTQKYTYKHIYIERERFTNNTYTHTFSCPYILCTHTHTRSLGHKDYNASKRLWRHEVRLVWFGFEVPLKSSHVEDLVPTWWPHHWETARPSAFCHGDLLRG